MKQSTVAFCAFGAISGLFLASGQAMAAPVRCACPATQVILPTTGSVTAASGKVTITGSDGTRIAAVGSTLPAGASLFTAAHASASVAFGASCGLQLAENSTLMVEQVDGKLCPRISELSVTVSPSAPYGAPIIRADVPKTVIAGFVTLSLTFLTISIAENKGGNGGAISP